jgi:alkylated DNA repair dioxygenase AlkB
MATEKTIHAPMATYNENSVDLTSSTFDMQGGVTSVTPSNIDPVLKAMSKAALTTYIKERVEQGRQLSIELLAALIEMKSRCKDEGTWHKTLLDCGIKPGTWRQWEFRELNAITTGKRTGDRKNGSGGTRGKTARTKTDRLGDPHLETEAQVVAKAGVQLATILQDPSLSEAARSAKASNFAREMIAAVEDGDYALIPAFPARAIRQWTHKERAALDWTLRLLDAIIQNDSSMPQAAETRKHAVIMREILEEEILGSPTPSGSDPDPEPPSTEPEPEPTSEIISPVVQPEPEPGPDAAQRSVANTPDIVLVPGFLSSGQADALFDAIRSKAEFQQNYIQLYGRKAIPRLEAWYGSWDYPYSSGIVLKAAPIPAYLQAIFDKIKDAGFGSYNAVLLNRYRSGSDYISPHSDADYGDPEPTIPSLTLGASRPFRLAKLVGKNRLDKATTVEYLPGHGDLLVMRGRTNVEWQHWVPKTAKSVGERINLTFRMMTKTEVA